MNRKMTYIFYSIIFVITVFGNAGAQTDYSDMANWACHPDKIGTLIDGYNLSIAVIDRDLSTKQRIEVDNNAMNDTGVDVFFVHPTVLQNIFSYTERENIPIEEQPGFLVTATVVGQAGLLAQFGRLFAPRYRQATPPVFIGSPLDEQQAEVIGVAYDDVRNAFLNYLEHQNNGNKVILAAHSQGSYLLSMLLRDIFDNDEALMDKLVVAVVAGMAAVYDESGTSGWWENISLCTNIDQCRCVMTWRCYKEGQTIPDILPSHPAQNQSLVDDGLVYAALDRTADSLFQDSLYYGIDQSYVDNYLTLNIGLPIDIDAGFVAFDSFYHIRYQRQSERSVGFTVDYEPDEEDLRPHLLAEEETNPTFGQMGYHRRDYNIYGWALIEQIKAKLSLCVSSSTSTSEAADIEYSWFITPNPVGDIMTFRCNGHLPGHTVLFIFDLSGQLVLQQPVRDDMAISLSNLPSGTYIVKVLDSAKRIVISR